MEQIKPGVVRGTMITMYHEDGSYQKPIEEVQEGDIIKTFDMNSDDYDGAHPEMNQATYKRVAKKTKQKATKLVKIKYSDGSDLITTIGHPMRMQAMPCGIVYRDDGIETRGCSEVDENMEEYDRVGARAKTVTSLDDVDDWAKELGYHFCCNVGFESYSPERKYTETKYDINDLRFNNIVTKNEWKTAQLQLGGFPILDGNLGLEVIRQKVDGDYDKMVEEAVTVVGFEDIDGEFETYTIGDTTGEEMTNYFANNKLISPAMGEHDNEQEHK